MIKQTTTMSSKSQAIDNKPKFAFLPFLAFCDLVFDFWVGVQAYQTYISVAYFTDLPHEAWAVNCSCELRKAKHGCFVYNFR